MEPVPTYAFFLLSMLKATGFVLPGPGKLCFCVHAPVAGLYSHNSCCGLPEIVGSWIPTYPFPSRVNVNPIPICPVGLFIAVSSSHAEAPETAEVAEAEQPFASVTVTEMSPTDKPVAGLVVAALLQR